MARDPGSYGSLGFQGLLRLLRRPCRAGVTAALCAAPLLAQAHVGTGAAHGHGLQAALSGFVHPFTGADHLLAMVTLGAWSVLTMQRAWAGPAAFCAALLAGALLGLAGLAVPLVEPMIALSLLVLGLLLASRRALPAWAAPMMAAGFAVFHGAAHGAELGGQAAAAVLAGMTAATALLHAGGMAIGLALGRRAAWLPRLAGAGVALFGSALLIG